MSFLSSFPFIGAFSADKMNKEKVEEDEEQLETQKLAADDVEEMHTQLPMVAHGVHFDSADAAAACAIQQPEMNLGRLRSISKVFTALPAQLPDMQQILLDVVEYWQHIILLETNPGRVASHTQQRDAAFEALTGTKNADKLLTMGRFFSRAQITSLASDVNMLRLEHNNSDENTNGEAKLYSDLTSDDWNTLKEDLILVKGFLQRKNANALPDEGTAGDEWPDPELAEHEMMTTYFQEVLHLISVQIALCQFRERLNETKTNAISTTPNRHTSPRMSNKEVEKAVSGYLEYLQTIFPPDSMDGDSSERSQTATVPIILKSFLLHDMYSPKKRAKQDKVDHLLSSIQSIMAGGSKRTPAGGTHAGAYSHEHLQQTMRSLLIKWSESILEIPTLVKLGYGGVTSPIIDKNEDDVSSWGGDQQQADSESEPEDPHRRMARKSITRTLKAVMRGRTFSVSEEEKDIIAQLAEAAGANRSREEAAYAVQAGGFINNKRSPSSDSSNKRSPSRDVSTQTNGEINAASTRKSDRKASPPYSDDDRVLADEVRKPPADDGFEDRGGPLEADSETQDRAAPTERPRLVEPAPCSVQAFADAKPMNSMKNPPPKQQEAKTAEDTNVKELMSNVAPPKQGPEPDLDSDSDGSFEVVKFSRRAYSIALKAREEESDEDDFSEDVAPAFAAAPSRKRTHAKGDDSSVEAEIKPSHAWVSPPSRRVKRDGDVSLSEKGTMDSLWDDDDAPVQPTRRARKNFADRLVR